MTEPPLRYENLQSVPGFGMRRSTPQAKEDKEARQPKQVVRQRHRSAMATTFKDPALPTPGVSVCPRVSLIFVYECLHMLENYGTHMRTYTHPYMQTRAVNFVSS